MGSDLKAVRTTRGATVGRVDRRSKTFISNGRIAGW